MAPTSLGVRSYYSIYAGIFALGMDPRNAHGDIIVGETSQRLGLVGDIPTDGQIGYIDYYFVVRGAKHRDLAEASINYIVGAGKQQQWLQKNWSSVANSRVMLPGGTPTERARQVAVTNEQWAAWHDYDWDTFFNDWDSWGAAANLGGMAIVRWHRP